MKPKMIVFRQQDLDQFISSVIMFYATPSNYFNSKGVHRSSQGAPLSDTIQELTEEDNVYYG